MEDQQFGVKYKTIKVALYLRVYNDPEVFLYF